MEPDVTAELVDITGQIVEGVRDPASNWAALIIVLLIVVSGVLLYVGMNHRNARIKEREEQLRQDVKDERERIKRDFEFQVTQHVQREAGYDIMLTSVNTALGGVTEAIRQNTAVLDGARRALDRSSDLVERLLPMPEPATRRNVPKKPAPRKQPPKQG